LKLGSPSRTAEAIATRAVMPVTAGQMRRLTFDCLLFVCMMKVLVDNFEKQQAGPRPQGSRKAKSGATAVRRTQEGFRKVRPAKPAGA
jgi:hypothetical protein